MHLIRWNLKTVLCQLGQELTMGLEWRNARLIGLGTESWFCFVFHQLVPHWSPISFSLPSPGRLAPSRAEVFVGSRCVRLVQALPSFPPLRWSWSVSVDPPLFFFSLAFQGLPAPGQVCWCVFAPSFFFCVPLFASWLSNFHLIRISPYRYCIDMYTKPPKQLKPTVLISVTTH